MSNYTHLHVHTVNSLLDGFTKVPDLVTTVKGLGMRSVAMTDHGTMAGIPQLWREAKLNDIKPIAGVEAYVCEDVSVKGGGKGVRSPYFHLTLLAKNAEGYGNLCKISATSYTIGFYYKPRVDLNLLRQHSAGLICLSGCVGGWPQQLILQGRDGEAIDVIIQLQEIFGEDFYLEMQDTGEKDQKIVNPRLLDIGGRLGIKSVLTGDSHYTKKEDFDIHDTLLCVGIHKTKADPTRMKFVQGEYCVKSYEEMLKLKYPIECYKSTMEIDEKCLRYDLPRASGLPNLKLNEDLEMLAFQGLERRMPNATETHWARLMYELSVIRDLGFDNYFLVIHDIVRFADEHGVFHGWGRGSSAGSIVAYALGVTGLDPIKYGLYFERFLNADRREPPDIDMDFSDTERGPIISYIENKYGRDCVARIGTYGTLGPRQVILDSAKVLGKSQLVVDTVMQCLPHDPALKTSDLLENKQVMRIIGTQLGKDVVQCIEQFNEVPRHGSIHAAGIIIESEPIIGKLPMMSGTGRVDLASQYAYDDVKSLGYEKFDILGVKTLRIIDAVREKLDLDFDSIPMDDAKAYQLLSSGRTTGVFQFESWGSQKFLREFKPKDFNDVMMATALYRPGPMQGGKGLEELLGRRYGRRPVKYLHPSLQPILKETYGLMIYQEQVMKVVQTLAGWTLNKADHLRYAIGKKKQELLASFKKEFIEDCIKQKLTKEFAETVFTEIEFFGRYGWNKSHAAAYGMVIYMSAYLKANHKSVFMGELMNADLGNHDRLKILVRECNAMALRVRRPDINLSQVGYTAYAGEDAYLLAGFWAIKGLGEKAAEAIVEDRKLYGRFTSEENFRERIPKKIVNSAMLDKLVVAGAFLNVIAEEVPF